ncbi:MAG: hypothetical protein KDB61_10115 [Planctomycetes bacterium]|nr:hypothetical protein [Planctomycetota bacterium]
MGDGKEIPPDPASSEHPQVAETKPSSMDAFPTFPHAQGHIPRGADRRKQPTPRFSRYSFGGGRRKHVRRPDEREGSYVDLYGMGILLAAIWVAMMNTGDSYFTLVHLQSGGIELNPFAQLLLQTGRFGFVFSKGLMITVAILVLIQHKNFWLARVGLWIAAGAYTVLNLYHLSLF